MRCYNCRRDFDKSELTKEHIPPRCFSDVYPDEFKQNRITVPCCNECNLKYSKIDQELRDLVAVLKDASDGNHKFLEKGIKSVVRGKELGQGIVLDPKSGKPLISFNYEMIEELFLKCHKGIFYHKYGIPIDDLFVSHVSQKHINEAHDTPLNAFIEGLHKKRPDSFIASGHEGIFRASMLGYEIIDGDNVELIEDPIDSPAIGTYMEFHGVIDCIVVGIRKDGRFSDIIKSV